MTLPRFFVYGLYDPAKPDVIRYVGAASHSGRPLEHAKESLQRRVKNNHKHNWIRSLGERGYGWRIIQECGSWDETMAAERATIALLRAAGVNLTNGTGGGEGVFRPTPEIKAKRVAAFRATLARPEAKAHFVAAAEARWADPVIRAKHAATLAAPEYRARRSEIAKRVNASPDVRAKMLTGHKLVWTRPGRVERQADVMRAYHELHPGRAHLNGKKAMHVRWHEGRGVSNPGCCLCPEVSNAS